MSLTSLRAEIKALYPNIFVKTREEFEGELDPSDDREPKALWMSGELQGDGSDIHADGRPLFDYYWTDPDYVFGVHPGFDALCNRHGCFCEWYDCGTLMVYLS